MARKAEEGILYFPINVDIFGNSKIKLLISDVGIGAFGVILPLYCRIYHGKGYWFDWMMEEERELFAVDDCKSDIEYVNKVVNAAIKRKLFNQDMFNNFGILTSARIQDNFLTAKSRVGSVPMIKEFCCVNKEGEFVYKKYNNVNIIDLSVGTIVKKVDIGTHNKKRIEGEGNGEGDSAKSAKHTPDEISDFKKFKDWIDKNAPRVMQMKEKFTIVEYLKLRKKLSGEFTRKLLLAMHNHKPLLTKNVSSYLTIINWSKKEVDPGKVAGSSASGNNTLSETVKAIEGHGVQQ